MNSATELERKKSGRSSYGLLPQFLALYLVPVAAGFALLIASGETLQVQFNFALGFLIFVVVLIWSLPTLRGGALGYPLQVISLIWLAVYGLGANLWSEAGNEKAIFAAYSAGFALAALALGYLLGHRSPNIHTITPPKKDTIILLDGVKRRAFLFVGISTVATAYFIGKGGMPIFHSDALVYRFEVRETVSSYVVFLLRSSQLPLYFFWAIYQLRLIPRTKRTSVLMWSAILLVLFVNYIPGWRNPLMFIAFNLFFIFVFANPTSKNIFPALLGAFAAFGVLLMGFVRLFRLSQTQAVGSIAHFSQFTTDPVQMFFLWAGAQFSNYTLGFLTSLSVFPAMIDHLNGNVIVTTLATMLPGRQELLDEKLKRWAGMEFEGGGLNLTILGESYADFGYIGLGVYPFVYGLLLGWLVRRAEQVASPATIVLAAFSTSSVALGSLTGLLALSSFWVLGAFLVFIAMGEKRRSV